MYDSTLQIRKKNTKSIPWAWFKTTNPQIQNKYFIHPKAFWVKMSNINKFGTIPVMSINFTKRKVSEMLFVEKTKSQTVLQFFHRKGIEK